MMWDSSGFAPSNTANSRAARVGVEVTADSVTLRPDQAFLADRNLVYPVVIDPGLHPEEKTNWATALSGKPTSSYWWTSGAGSSVAQVGQCYDNGYCNDIHEAWAYFQFDSSDLGGKVLHNATFKTVATYSPSCNARDHQLHLADRQITAGMTWDTRPASARHLGTVSVGAVHTNCTGHKGVEFDIDTWGIGTTSTYYMRASSSTDQLAWRKYDPAQTKLSIDYNTIPEKPTELSTDPPLPAACGHCAGVPYLADASIRLRTRLNDADGDLLRPQWRLAENGAETAAWDGPQQASGAMHDVQIDLTGKNGKTVGWWVHGADSRHSSTAFPAGSA